MVKPPTRHRAWVRLSVAAAIAVVTWTLSGCGGTPAPVGTPSPAVATTSASSKPTATATPLSRFEDQAPVKAVRTWLAAAARAVNAGDVRVRGAAGVLSAEGRRSMPGTLSDDRGRYYPGPMPFTPTRVDVTGATAKVYGCLTGDGFAEDRATHRPARGRKVLPVQFWLSRDGGHWRIDNLYDAAVACRRVRVVDVKW